MTPPRTSVIWTTVALVDLERLAVYLLDESPDRADAVLDRIINRAESLESFPERGRTPPELRSVGDRTWREIQEPPYRIFDRVVSRQRVEIHGVIDGRRNLMDVLLERVLRS